MPQSLSRTVRELRVEELQLLTSRVEASDRTFGRVTSTLVAVAVSSGLLLVWVFGLVVRDERKRRDVEAVLRRANEDLDAHVSARTAELHDALDREQALRREAEASSRLKDEFLMTVSHELRTPLNSLLGWADMLRLGIVSDGRRRRAVEAIYDNAKLQTQLIDDLLDTARILTGKLRIEPTVVDLGEIVHAAANVVAPAAAAKGLELKVETGGHRSRFLGDPGRLQQIVWNLVSNAVKFTEHGTVSVRLVRSEDYTQTKIIVADTGIGINRDFLPVCLRPVQPGEDRHHPAAWRTRARLGDCSAARRTAWRYDSRPERWRRTGRCLYGHSPGRADSHGRGGTPSDRRDDRHVHRSG